MTASLEDIWHQQDALQKATFGRSPMDMTDAEAVEYIKQMVLECTDELHEVLGELTAWKGHHKGRAAPRVNREQAGREARDALQYVINILIACGWTPATLFAEYDLKIQVNHARLGGVGGAKCPVCRRALDDVGVECTEEACANA